MAWAPRRWGLIPRRTFFVDFSEDPRDGSEDERDLPPRRPSWRSLRRALRRARGPVLYARRWWWYECDGKPVRCCSAIPVAYLHTDGTTWVTDWSAVEEVENRRRARVVEAQWEDWLSPDHAEVLDVMRLCHVGRHASRHSGRVGPLARRLLGQPSALCELVDDAWVIDWPRGCSQDGAYRVVIGISTSRSRRVGEFADMKEAQQAALDAVDDARRRLASLLAERGGIAAEFAAARARWPRPSVRFVPSPD
ncbi:MAG: hypothetical protein QOK43_2995 [Acidimicrobiaceae bacterium]|nr:hypothetical protein [Acidimicrobiaceae bacterium]